MVAIMIVLWILLVVGSSVGFRLWCDWLTLVA